MTTPTPPPVVPLDPDSELGQRIANELADLIDDVDERLAREKAAAAIAASGP